MYLNTQICRLHTAPKGVRLGAGHRLLGKLSTKSCAMADNTTQTTDDRSICAGGSPAGPFDFSQPPFRLAPDPPELRLFSLSGVDVFGCHCLARHWAMMLGSSFLLGLKGPLLGAAIWAAYKYWSHGEQLLLWAAAFLHATY